MVEPLTQVLGRWMQTTREALRAGAKQEDLAAMLQTAADQEEDAQAQLPSECGLDTIYDELPEGLIDVPSAAAQYHVPRQTIQSWITAGKLSRMGRLRGRAPGGGYNVIAERQLLEIISRPKDKGGRPKKTSASY